MKKLLITICGAAIALSVMLPSTSVGAESITGPANGRVAGNPAKRLSPSERTALVGKLLEQRVTTDPTILRNYTNVAPRKVVGEKNEVSERINAVLKK